MEDKGCYERLWEAGELAAVRKTLGDRMEQTCTLLDGNMDTIVKILPGVTLEDARQTAEEV